MSCSKLFAHPYANYSLAILQFAPEVAVMQVSKAWNERMNLLLKRWWENLPTHLKAEKASIEQELGEGSKYTLSFKKLNALLAEKLRAIHPNAPREIAKRFAHSLSVKRILATDSKIGSLPCYQKRLVSDLLCFKAQRRIFEYAADIALPQVSKTWYKRMNRTLDYIWWKALPQSLGTATADLYHGTRVRQSSYYTLFQLLTDVLAEQLTKLDETSSYKIHQRFKDSLSPQRVVVLQERIVYCQCLLKIWMQARDQAKSLRDLKWPRAIEEQFRLEANTSAFDKIKLIDLSGMRLTTVPLEFVRFRELETLILSDNHLNYLPEFLFYFLKLRKIILWDNFFRPQDYLSIARKIADHEYPEIFVLGDTSLSLVVRKEIDLATSLKKVWSEIHAGFPDQLEGVYANPEKRRRLKPSQIRKLLLNPVNSKFLDRITHLDLSRSALHELAPEIFVGLRNLQAVSLSENPLRNLPFRQMMSLQKLEFLDLTSTDFTPHNYPSIEEGLRALPALKHVVHHSRQKKQTQKPPTTRTTTQQSVCCVVQ